MNVWNQKTKHKEKENIENIYKIQKKKIKLIDQKKKTVVKLVEKTNYAKQDK